MSTRKLFVGALMAIFTFTLCTVSYAQENRILMTTSQQYQNMVADSDFESWGSGATSVPDGWASVSEATPTYAQDTTEKIGTYAVQLTAGAGSDKGMQQTVIVLPNTTYTISLYYKSSATNHTAKLYVDGAASLVAKEDLETAAGTWKRYSKTFTTGAGDTSITIKLYAADGEAVSFDGAMLTEGHTTPAFAALPITDTGDHTMYGALTVEGTTNLNGDVNLGNLVSDTITLKGTLKGIDDTNIAITPQGTGIVDVTGDLTLSGNLNIAEGAIKDAMIVTDDLKDSAVTSAKIAADTIVAGDIATSAVTTTEILDETIATTDLADNAVTSAKIATDTIVAGDIATSAVGTAEILDGTIGTADIGMLRATAKTSANKTIDVAPGVVYVSGNTLVNVPSVLSGNFDAAGNLVYTPTTDPFVSAKYVKVLVSLNSSGDLSSTTGTEKDTIAAAKAEGMTYPVDELPIVEVILKTTDTLAGAIENIESSEGSLSFVYRDVRPFINVGGGNSVTATTYTIGSGTDETANDITLAFGDATGGNEILVYAGSGATAALDMFKLSDDLMINSGATASTTDVVLTFGGTDPQTITYTGSGGTAALDRFAFSDEVNAPGYYVSGASLAATHLSDGASVAHIDASENVTGGWSFETSATAFTTDVNMTYAGAENLAITSAASTAVDALTLDITATSADAVRGIVISQNASGAEPLDVGLEIINLDTDDAMSTAIKITPTQTITTGLDLGGTQVTNSGNITGSGAVTVASGSASDLGLTGTYGVNITATAQDVAINATTASAGGVKLTGTSSAFVDVGVASDGVIDVDAASITIDKAAAGTLKLRSGTTEYLAIDANEAITIGDSVTPTAMTINASTIGITPTDNVTVSMAEGKNIYIKDASGTPVTIMTIDETNQRVAIHNLQVTGEETIVNTTTTDVDHISIGVGGVSTVSNAIDIEPDSGLTWTGNILTAKNANAGSNVFVIDNSGNITTAGTYNTYTIGHSTHAQNTDTGTSGASFKIASAADAAAADVTLTFGNTNAESIIFQGASTDNFVFSNKVVATGFDAVSGGITNVGNISDDANINIDLTGAATRTLGILNSTDAQVTNVSVDGGMTAASLAFDNSTLNADTWTTSGSVDITLSPAGANILPGTHESYDIGSAVTIGSPQFSGTGTLTLSTTTYDAYVTADKTYIVKLDLAGDVGTAKFKWSNDNGSSWVATGITTSASDIALENGIAVKFSGSAGALNDQWTVAVTANTGWRAMYTEKLSTDAIYAPTIYPEASGGTITIQGNLNVTGTQTITGITQYAGAQTITATSATAFLVENAGGTDAFIVDTATPQVNVLTNLDVSGTLTSGDSDAFQIGTTGTILAAGGSFDVDVSGNITDVSAITSDGAISTSGNISTTGTGAITAANGLTVSANGAAITGGVDNNSGGITNAGAISGASTIVASSTLTSLRSVGLIPEYDNATPRGDGSNNFGTLSLEYGSSHNYYEWTTDEPTTQDYDIVVRFRLPDGFSSFDDTAPIKLFNTVSDVNGSTAVTVTMLDTDGNAVTLSGGSGLKKATWTESTITITGTPTFDAEGYVTIIIKMFADQGDTVDVGEMTLKGNW